MRRQKLIKDEGKTKKKSQKTELDLECETSGAARNCNVRCVHAKGQETGSEVCPDEPREKHVLAVC